MKKVGISILFISLIVGSLWHNRLDILLSIAPTLRAWQLPVGPNQPVLWTQGPTLAAQPPSQRPPNIILILADDMGWTGLSCPIDDRIPASKSDFYQTPRIES